ncbi:MAG: carbohydrate kinase family protein [Saprospiraceae bacterium]|nr:carbohydrate kinase family protein [Saprospiraceae bacterium]
MSKPFDVLVIGELNIDLILNELSATPKIGAEVLANEMNLTLGSSSAIFAANIASLGLKTSFLGKVGSDLFGRFTMEELRKGNVDTTSVLIDATTKTGATIVLNEMEDRANVTFLGAMANLKMTDIPFELFDQFHHLHISSFYFQTGLKEDIGYIFQSARKAGLTTSFDMQWDPLEKWEINYDQILPHVSIFLPNELEIIHSTKSRSLPEAVNKIKDLCEILTVKMGVRGSIMYSMGNSIEHPSYHNPKVIDAIGAGDSFNAGFIYAFLKGYPVDQCQKLANIIGAISTTMAGGTTAFQKKVSFRL